MLWKWNDVPLKCRDCVYLEIWRFHEITFDHDYTCVKMPTKKQGRTNCKRYKKRNTNNEV